MFASKHNPGLPERPRWVDSDRADFLSQRNVGRESQARRGAGRQVQVPLSRNLFPNRLSRNRQVEMEKRERFRRGWAAYCAAEQ